MSLFGSIDDIFNEPWGFRIQGTESSIFRPHRVEFVAALQTTKSAGGKTPIVTGLSGLNLLATAGALPIAPQVYHSIRELHLKLNAMTSPAVNPKSRIELIVKLSRKIDHKISQSNLREAIKHTFRKALTPESINLKEFMPIATDINDLIEAYEFDIFDLKLTSDLRDYLQAMTTFFFDLRHTIAQQHNIAVNGDPLRTVNVNPTVDYLGHEVPHIASNFGLSLLQSHLVALLDADVNNKLVERFEFATNSDLLVFSNLIKKSSEKLEKYVSQSIPQVLITPVVYYLTGTLYTDVEMILDGLSEERTPTEVRTQLNRARKKTEQIARSILERPQTVEDLVSSWLWGADGGLVLRFYVELLALRDGYQNTFWSHLRGQSNSGTQLIELECDCREILTFQKLPSHG